MAGNAETGRIILEEMYNFATSSMNAAVANLGGKAGFGVSMVFEGITLTKDLSMMNGSNTNQKIGIIVGDLTDFIMLQGVISKASKPIDKVAIAFFGTELTAHISMKEIMIPFYTEYVPHADAFYTKLLTDDNFFEETLEGLKNNAWDNLKYMFTDSNGDVSPSSLVQGIKNLFGPPSYNGGNATLEIELISDNHVKIDYSSLHVEAEASIVQEIEKYDQITQLTLNSQTYDITKENNLTVRNAIDDIPKVSFLLSHILIKTGEILDIGEYGLYKVQSGDTMSQIAERYGFTTQELLKYNTWLIDDGRLTFDQSKVLIETDASNLTNKDHTLTGTDTEDRLIDHNGGDDILIGNGGDDYLDGSKDFISSIRTILNLSYTVSRNSMIL